MQDVEGVHRLPAAPSTEEMVPSNGEVVVRDLNELAREGARRIIAAALEVEVERHVAWLAGEGGKRLAVCEGDGRKRRATVRPRISRIGAERATQRRAAAESEESRRCGAWILPGYAQRSPMVSDALPLLYLRGCCAEDLVPALEVLLGQEAVELSPGAIDRLIEEWHGEREAFRTRRLDIHRYCYVFVDGVHVSVRVGEDDQLCLLVVIGVREDGVKELLAVQDGYRDNADSWMAVLGDLKARGMSEPTLVVGDSALGIWETLWDVFPGARGQHCWAHAIPRVSRTLPRWRRPKAKLVLGEMMQAPTSMRAQEALEVFRDEFDAKYPEALVELDRDWCALTAFYDFPVEHWCHLRTSNPIEASFATARLGVRATKRAGSQKTVLAMAYKLLDAAGEHWRRFNSAERIADVLDGVTFEDGTRASEGSHDDGTPHEKIAA